MSTSETSSELTPKRRIIANQTAELVTLQQQLARFEGVGKRFEEHKLLLDDSIKAKHALQEIFFNTTIEKRRLESENKRLNDIINEKDYIIKECKDDNLLEVDSIKHLHALEISNISKKCNKLTMQKECYIDAIAAKHRFKSDLSSIKYDALSVKYKFISSQNKQLSKHVKLFQSKMVLMQKHSKITSKYEAIIISLLEQSNELKQKCQTEINKREEIINKLSENSLKIRQMYNNLKVVVQELDDKIIKISNKNNTLNTIILQNDIATTKMQQHFQNDIANKARSIEKLETKIEQILNNSNTNASANDNLKEQNEMLKAQVDAYKHEKNSLRGNIKTLQDKLNNKNDYINTLKKQIEENNENIHKLNRENASMNESNKSKEKVLNETLNENDNNFKKLSEKYKTLQIKAQKLAQKLKQTYADKKENKKKYIEIKHELEKLKEENIRIDAETDKQNDALQLTMAKYKEKISKRNQQIEELEHNINTMSNECNGYKQQIAFLQKENEQQKFLIESLEIDNNETVKAAHKRRDVRKKNRNTYQQIENENSHAQNQCHHILQEIENDNTSDYENDDISHINDNKLSGNKRRRSIDNNDNNNNEPAKKKARRSGNNNNSNNNNNNKNDQLIDATPFKANKSMFKPRKQRNKKNVNLPKPRLV